MDSRSSSGSGTGCLEKWRCTNWSECIDGWKTRVCDDMNKCGTLEFRPIETINCESEPEEIEKLSNISEKNGENILSKITGAVIGGKGNELTIIVFLIVIIAALIILALIRNK